jgi:pSer/pThr/pTyr-binding forkhead associated (FHA) protein
VMASVFCAQCGHQNPGDARFCGRCGAPLTPRDADSGQPAADQTSTLSIAGLEVDDRDDLASELLGEQLPSGFALLVVQRGPNAGSRYLLDQEVTTAGRSPDSDIFLDDVTVSRHHATFTRTPEGYVVADTGSLNGTYVNRARIDSAVVGNGDEVQIGKFRLLMFTSLAAGER